METYYTQKEYEDIKKKWSWCSSWAIWDIKNRADTSIIDRSVHELSPRYVLVGLNVSGTNAGDFEPWTNFHPCFHCDRTMTAGNHDKKLIYACNDTELRGSYMTDIIKRLAESDSGKVSQKLEEDKTILEKSIAWFLEEMKDIKLTPDSVFILFGDKTQKLYEENLKHHFPDNRVIKSNHYSYYGRGGTDREFVESLWEKVGIVHDFDVSLKKNEHSPETCLRCINKG